MCRERSRSPRQQSFGEEDGGVLTLTDELALVGFTEDLELNTIFEESGEWGCHYCSECDIIACCDIMEHHCLLP